MADPLRLTVHPTLIHRARGATRLWQLLDVLLKADRPVAGGRLQIQYGRVVGFQAVEGPLGPGVAWLEIAVEPQLAAGPARIALETLDALGAVIQDFELRPAPLGQVLLTPDAAGADATLDLAGNDAWDRLRRAIGALRWRPEQAAATLPRVGIVHVVGGWEAAPTLAARWAADYRYPRLAVGEWLPHAAGD